MATAKQEAVAVMVEQVEDSPCNPPSSYTTNRSAYYPLSPDPAESSYEDSSIPQNEVTPLYPHIR